MTEPIESKAPSKRPASASGKPDLPWQGLNLLAQGDFAGAKALIEQVLPQNRKNNALNHAYAALLSTLGDPGAAQVHMQAHFEQNPLSRLQSKGSAPLPLLLLIRGFDQTRPVIGKNLNGVYKPKLRGGHFTTQYLLAKDNYARQIFTISGPSPLDSDAFPAHDLMLNTIADPDVEGASLQKFGQYLNDNPQVRVLNHPDRIWDTARDRNYQRFQNIPNVIFPRTIRLNLHQTNAGNLDAMLRGAGMQMPYILRRVGTQTGQTVALINNFQDLESYAQKPLSGGFYAIAYREILWRGEYFRKLRLFCIDGKYYPVVCHLDQTWNVHGGNRKEIMRDRDDLVDEEKRFLSDWETYVGAENVMGLKIIEKQTALEFFGIDFTIDSDGKIFIYELNAAMRHSFDHGRNFPYKIPYDQAITDAFGNMVEARLPEIPHPPV